MDKKSDKLILGLTKSEPSTKNETHRLQELLNLPQVKFNTYSAAQGEDLTEWFNDIEMKAQVLGLKEEDILKRIPTLISGTALKWYLTMRSKLTTATLKEFKGRMMEDLNEPDYLSNIANKLITKKQTATQDVTSYIYDIRDLCNRMNSKMEPHLIITFILNGIDPELKPWIGAYDTSSLDDFIVKARLAERSYKAHLEVRQKNHYDTELQTARLEQLIRRLENVEMNPRRERPRHRDQYLRNYQPQMRRESRYGYRDEPRRRQDPICWECNQPGHLRNNCPLNRQQTAVRNGTPEQQTRDLVKNSQGLQRTSMLATVDNESQSSMASEEHIEIYFN